MYRRISGGNHIKPQKTELGVNIDDAVADNLVNSATSIDNSSLGGWGVMLDALQDIVSEENLELILNVYDFASKLHEGQFRDDGGEVFKEHVLQVTQDVVSVVLPSELFLSLNTEEREVFLRDVAVVALLHDAFEDGSNSVFDDLKELLGVDYATLLNARINALTKPGKGNNRLDIQDVTKIMNESGYLSEEADIDNEEAIHKIFLAIEEQSRKTIINKLALKQLRKYYNETSDIIPVLVKLADRFNNTTASVDVLSQNKQSSEALPAKHRRYLIELEELYLDLARELSSEYYAKFQLLLASLDKE